ncbi:condensin complex subunit 3 isoform X2 [Periplaneta americana]|uniref:condensin complex subunit 3 isoform X2 n=1 Tax=Periplaneta americana TaxID=6978 RepID=UPI0037E8C820
MNMSRRPKDNVVASTDALETLFYNAQMNTTNHEKLLKHMKQEFETKELEVFFINYIRCLKHFLVIGEKHVTVERALEFAAKFSVSLYDEHASIDSSIADDTEEVPPFLKKLFNFLFIHHQTRDHNVRFRVCQFINKLLNNLGEEASLDDELCNKICVNMLERLQDKLPAVRTQAVMALQRLQDPTSADCPVIKAYLFHLGADPSPAVRRSVLNCIGRTNVTLPHILERTRDVKDTVRRHAYYLLTKLNIRSFTIRQRERLLREGLKDRSEHVSNFVATVLLPAWLRNMKGNYLDLLHALDVENSTETSILALTTFLKHRPLKELMDCLTKQQTDKVIPLDKLTSENALFWRCLAEHLHKEGDEDLDDIIPDLTPFCQYVRSFYLAEQPKDTSTWSQIQRQFVVVQLLELAKVFDLGDEMGRSNLKKLIYDMLTCTYVKEGLVPVLVELLVSVQPHVNSRLLFLAEIVSEVHEPMTQVSVEISSEERRKKQLMVREQRNDRATLSKCLTIIYEMMKSPTVTSLTPHLRSLMENFVIRFIEDCDTYVRSLALRAIGVFCLLDQELAKQYILMFYFQLANNESEEVCIMTLKVIFDLFMLYGLRPFQMEEEDTGEKETDKTGRKKLFDVTELDDTDDESTTDNTQSTALSGSTNFITILTNLLDSTSADMRAVTAEGLCKLLLANIIKSSNLVSRLLIMWYNPVTEGDIFLRQMLGAFFTTYAANSRWGQETLEQALLPTLRTLFQAPVTSPLVEVDQDSVVRLMLNLTRPGINQEGTQGNVHNNLAIALSNEVLDDQDPYNMQVLLRAMIQLELVLDDPVFVQIITTVTEKMAESVKDKTCLRYIQKFQQLLTNAKENITTTDRTAVTIEGTDTGSMNTDMELQSVENSQAASSMESDESDSDISQPRTPYPPLGRTVIPETPENSDSPLSEMLSDATQSDDAPPHTRRSGRIAKRSRQ